MNTVLRAKSAIARRASNLAWKRMAVPFMSTQWQATKSPCTWKSGSMWTRTSSGPESPVGVQDARVGGEVASA